MVNPSALSVTTVAEILFAIGAVNSSIRSEALNSVPSCRVCLGFLVANGEERCLRCSWNVGIGVSFRGCSDKFGDALLVKSTNCWKFNIADNVKVSATRLPDKR